MRELPADSASPMLTSLVTFLFSDKKVTPIVLGNSTINTNLDFKKTGGNLPLLFDEGRKMRYDIGWRDVYGIDLPHLR